MSHDYDDNTPPQKPNCKCPNCSQNSMIITPHEQTWQCLDCSCIWDLTKLDEAIKTLKAMGTALIYIQGEFNQEKEKECNPTDSEKSTKDADAAETT